MKDTILITSEKEKPHPTWKPVDCFFVEGYRAFVSKDLPICEREL